MDINSLLSPQLSPQSPARRPSGPVKRSSSNLSTSSLHKPPALARSAVVQVQQLQCSAATNGSGSSSGRIQQVSAQGTPNPNTELRRSPAMSVESLVTHHQPTHYSRSGSTSGMDTLADLASMQQHQQTPRSSISGLRNAPVYAPSRSPSLAKPQTTQRNHSLSHSSATMTDHAAKTPPPRPYASRSMSESDLQTVREIVNYLSENSYAYEYHVRLINLLHQGFLSHVYSGGAPDPVNDPHDYELLTNLRQAREAMDSRFPVGEELWVDWIKDECLLARTTEDRIAVMELCRRAVADEVASVAIWRLYGDWMWSLYCTSFGVQGPATDNSALGTMDTWSEEDRTVGREVFAKEPALHVWSQAVGATMWRINDSNIVWDRYIEILMFDTASSTQKATQIQGLFEARLKTPHATWDRTFSNFSTFISNRYRDEQFYEETMIAMNQAAAPAKQQYALREMFELRVQKSRESGDKNAEWAAYCEYLEFEVSQSRKRNTGNLHLLVTLYERVTLRFPTYANLWEDYIDLLLELQEPVLPSAPVAQRAVRHCPWSGNLWSHLLIITEAGQPDFQAMEAIKHKATKTGLLDVGGMEELIKVYSAWCGFLRRRAFQAGATEDELDIAEVGILSSIEDVRKFGEKTYGNDYKGDTSYRIETIFIKFLSQLGRNDEARSKWRELVPHRGDSWEFWYRFYNWEMVTWGKTQKLQSPQQATAVLRQAIRRPNLDWPEKMIETFRYHCEQHETVQEVQNGLVQARKASKAVEKRREREAAETAAVAQQQQQQQQHHHQASKEEFGDDESPGGGKRKRDQKTSDAAESASKRIRPDEPAGETAATGYVGASATSQVKRDRENTTVTVKNLPPNTTETRLRQYFRDCGTILSLNLIPEGDTMSATIEFETREDVLSAGTRNMKSFDGNEIEIQVGTGTTVWVTNFPPAADEAYIRDLFKQYGDVVDVRFPSLKFNAHRRFSYVQFLTASQAKAATQLHGTALRGGYKIQVKISDPSQRKERTGAMYEKREIYVGNVDWQATEEELRDLFKQYGEVESVRIPRNMAGKSKGAAFVTFKTKVWKHFEASIGITAINLPDDTSGEIADKAQEQAASALGMNLKDFKGRVLTVTISIPNATGKRQATTIHTSGSPDPSEATLAGTPATSDTSAAPTHKERTVVLLDVPDTVNDARIGALMGVYGPLKKIVLRPDRNGATVEYENVADAGKASMGMDGYEIVPGKRIRVGTLDDLKKQEKGTDRLRAGQVSRPGQPGARRGGRGGLGSKRGGLGLRGSRATVDERKASGGQNGKDEHESTGDVPKGGKSNAYFKAKVSEFLNQVAR